MMQRTDFLRWVEAGHGPEFHKVCAEILDESPQADIIPMRVIAEAERRIYKDELEDAVYWASEAPLAGEYCGDRPPS